MFSRASLGQVWWPFELVSYNEHGEPVQQKVTFLFRPLTEPEQEAREHDNHARLRQAAAARIADRNDGASDAATSLEQVTITSIDSLIATLEERSNLKAETRELIAERTLDWRVKTDKGEAVAFDRDFLRELLTHGQYFSPISEAFNACCQGAVRKNSLPGPAGSRGPARA